LNSNTVNFTDNPNGYTVGSSIGSFIFASLFWGYSMWYYNRIIPGDYGQALPWYFPYQRSYWCGAEARDVQLEGWEEDVKYENVPIEKVGAALKEQERVGDGVHIRGLTKTFGEKTAVEGLDLSMYTGQVFALLGHNGAGKTTTISMLTGMFSPSEGYAVINGKDIRTQMQDIREDLGICLQHDCLFPQLTVKEHLRFFSRIKGLYESNSFKDAEAAIDESIRDVALFEKRNTFSKDLSGGMKRKLSLAVAFCGGSKVVFLDEVRFKTIFAINAHHNHHLTQVFSQQAEWTLLAGDLFGMLFVKTVKIDALSLLPISWMRQTCLVIVLELWQKVT
jgi:ABC-type Na+ transport system ATPase subunit NatA